MNSDFYKKEFNSKREKQAKYHTDAVDGNELLTELVETVKKYVITDNEIIVVVVLWCILTWCMDMVYYAPILHITSCEKQSGKTKLLNILKRLSFSPEIVSSITDAALFRKISEHQNTLLFDQLGKDFLKHKKVKDIFVNGVINDGRTSSCCVGKDNNPKPYRLWGAKAICSLGVLPKEMNAFSIVLPLRKKLKNERIIDIISSNPEIWDKLIAKIARFVENNKGVIATIEVPCVEELTDTMNDYWSPLLKIALSAGENWFERAKKAAISLTGEDETENNNIELLKVIKTIFDEKQGNNIGSDELCTILNEQYPALKNLNKGKELIPRGLANILREFGISSKTVNLSSNKKLKGYQVKQFTDIFNKYL